MLISPCCVIVRASVKSKSTTPFSASGTSLKISPSTDLVCCFRSFPIVSFCSLIAFNCYSERMMKAPLDDVHGIGINISGHFNNNVRSVQIYTDSLLSSSVGNYAYTCRLWVLIARQLSWCMILLQHFYLSVCSMHWCWVKMAGHVIILFYRLVNLVF